MNPQLLSTASAFGLAASAGLNTTLPLFIVGFLARINHLVLSPPYEVLASDFALAGLLFLSVLELAGDKVPGLDSVVHGLQWPFALTAGAVLFASQSANVQWVSPELTVLVGMLTAGTVHAARSAVRPFVTMATFGLGNSVLSLAEDAYAMFLAVTSLLAPPIGFVLTVLLLVGTAVGSFWVTQRAIRLLRKVLGISIDLVRRGSRAVVNWARRDTRATTVIGPEDGAAVEPPTTDLLRTERVRIHIRSLRHPVSHGAEDLAGIHPRIHVRSRTS